MDSYYTVIVPYSPPGFRTEWHPDTSVGPFSTLSRGSFYTYAAAVAWARDHLDGLPYTIKFCAPESPVGWDKVGG